jgi:hypothetical protein
MGKYLILIKVFCFTFFEKSKHFKGILQIWYLVIVYTRAHTLNEYEDHWFKPSKSCYSVQWRTQEFFAGGGGVQQIQLRTEGRENGDLGAVAS